MKSNRNRSPHYQADRAALLHKLCRGIARARSRGVARLASVRRACTLFRCSPMARERGVGMSMSTMRFHFARWQKNPCPSVFQRKAVHRDLRIIPRETVPDLEEYAIEHRISVAELHRRIVRDNPDKPLSYATVCRAIQNKVVIRCVRRSFLQAVTAHKKSIERALAAMAIGFASFFNGGLRA